MNEALETQERSKEEIEFDSLVGEHIQPIYDRNGATTDLEKALLLENKISPGSVINVSYGVGASNVKTNDPIAQRNYLRRVTAEQEYLERIGKLDMILA